jgi:hypothetical protein
MNSVTSNEPYAVPLDAETPSAVPLQSRAPKDDGKPIAIKIPPIEETKEPYAVPLTTAPTTPAITDAPVRPSNPIKQGIAGITDVITTLPGFAGLIGASAEAGYNYATDGTDKGITEQFDEAIKTGTDADLIKITDTARNFVNDSLKIKNPISTEDQAARIFGAFMVPIPGSSAVSVLNKAASFVLPLVRTGAGFGKRVAQQAVIGGTLGTAMDQGMRAMTDHPLMFSEQALTGKLPESTTPSATPYAVGLDDNSNLALQKLDRKVQDETDRQNANEWYASGAALMIGAALARRPIARTLGKLRDPVKVGNDAHEGIMDATTSLESLADIGVSQRSIDRTISNSRTDPTDMAHSWLNQGQLSDDFKYPAHLTPMKFSELNEQYIALGKDRQQLFNDATTASIDKIERLKGKETRLWPTAKTDMELDTIIAAAEKDGGVKKLMDHMGQQYELLLRYRVHKNVMTQAKADELLLQAQVNGRVGYMPVYHPDERTFFQRIRDKYFTIGSKAHSESSYLSEFAPSNPISGGKHLTPLDAYQRYSIHTITDAIEQSYKGNLLDRMAQVGRNAHGGEYLLLDPLTQKPLNTVRDVTYIGRATDLSNPESITISAIGHPKKEFHGKTLSDLRNEKPGEIVTAVVNGELRVYHVPDKGLRAALDLNPQLTGGLKHLSAWKNLATRGSTGNLSLFAPMSAIYSSEQIAMNTASKYGLGAGFKTIYDSLKGTGQMLAIDGASDIAQFLGQRIARHVAKTGAPPSMMQGLQKYLNTKILNSMLGQVRREGGRTMAGQGNVGLGTMDEIMSAIGRNSSDYFGKDQMGLVSNLWRTWNNAMHEGPAFGSILKHIGDVRVSGNPITPQVLRDASNISKSLAGDQRRRGSSQAAVAFNAAVPFSSAMLQSWNSIGAAAKHNWGKFIVGATALIGVPTMSELAWNYNVDKKGETFTDSEGKKWTYMDYYWNGFTPLQRISNRIAFIPGRPPWDAALMPIGPEWGLFRAVVLEASDAIFDLSTVGNMAPDLIGGLGIDQKKVNRDHIMTAVSRITDVPMIPELAAGLSLVGANVQVSLHNEVNSDPGSRGESMGFIRNIPMGQGSRYNTGSQVEEGAMNEKVAAIMQDIFGAAGAAYVKIHNAFMLGVSSKDGSIGEGLGRSLDALGGVVKQQMRYGQVVWRQSIHPSASTDEITQSYIASKKSMQHLAAQVDRDYLRGGMMYADGKLVSGDSIIASDDPVNMMLADIAKRMLQHYSSLDQEINQIHADIKTIPSDRSIGSLKERDDKKNGLTLQLQRKRAESLALIHESESIISHELSAMFKRDIQIRFSDFNPRPNLPTSSIFQELQKPPQTSQ